MTFGTTLVDLYKHHVQEQNNNNYNNINKQLRFKLLAYSGYVNRHLESLSFAMLLEVVSFTPWPIYPQENNSLFLLNKRPGGHSASLNSLEKGKVCCF